MSSDDRELQVGEIGLDRAQASVDELAKTVGIEHPETLVARDALVSALEADRRFVEATIERERLTDASARVLGRHALETLKRRDGLGMSYVAQGRYVDGLRVMSELDRYWQQVRGEARARAIASQHFAVALYHAGEWAAAADASQTALDEHGSDPGSDFFVPTAIVLGTSLRRLGRVDEAVEVFGSALDSEIDLEPAQRRALMTNLANCLWDRGELASAVELEESVLNECRSEFGNEDARTLQAMLNLGVSYFGLGDFAAAEALERDAVVGFEALLRPSHPSSATARLNLAETLQRLGQVAEAESLLRTVLRDRTTELGDSHPDTLTATSALALNLVLADRLDEALQLASDASTALAEQLGADHRSTLVAGVYAAEAAARLGGREDEALVGAIDALDSVVGSSAFEVRRARYRLARLMLTRGRRSEAISILEALRAVQVAALPNGHPDIDETDELLRGSRS
ncbi:MAG: tetratricopeptide repeat protein [Actinomycetota bacterium]